MKKKAGIITIIDSDNYGNRLQNYAVQEVIKKQNIEAETIINYVIEEKRKNILYKTIRKVFAKIKHLVIDRIPAKRVKNFKKFTEKLIHNTNFVITPTKIKEGLNDEYDYFIVGSDQVWNPNWRLSNIDLLSFADANKRIAFSASIGVDSIPEEKKELFSTELKKFKNISVREDKAKEIAKIATNREDIEVLIDPTMLLTEKEWNNIAQKPKEQIPKKYILLYFLGELSDERKKEIERIAKEKQCKIINMLDSKSKFYASGPREFLYLERNAFLICTDSFHSCVFAILYNRPFIVFEREGKACNMSSRIRTLLKKFELNNREFTGKITEENIKHDYTEAYKILNIERKKSMNFLKKAFDLEEKIYDER